MFVSFLVKNGRAVLYPIYKGSFERRTSGTSQDRRSGQYQWAEWFIQTVKDFRRCIDYLETRQDVDSKKVAYYGMSEGGIYGAIITAVEPRMKASILTAGSFGRPIVRSRREVSPISYVTRVRIPTLMLNGKYDTLESLETSIRPLFDLLGTPAEHKALKLYETDHIPPRNESIKETLAWLDRYLGPVK
jgi:dienelactone hydrolase